ncbi:hypothetical protein BH24CHL6_BH24CHL6_03400 [soil metagenome]
MTGTKEDSAGRWDLEWEADRQAGRPERYPPSLDATYAEFPLRGVAFVLDVLLVSLLYQLMAQGRSLLALWFTRDSPAANDGALVISGALLVLAITGATLSAVYFWRVFRATPGQMVLGLFVVQRGRGLPLRRRAALVRWLLLYAPLAVFLAYTPLIDVVFRSGLASEGDPLLVATAAYFLPPIWYAVLGLSVLAEGRRGRGLHDRLAGSVVIRRAGPPA